MADKSWDDQYISKTDAIKLAIISIVPFANADNINGIQNSFEKTIGDFPSADVQPVVHGKWELAEDGWYCSSCELYPPFDCDPEEKGIPYCPNCGADMRDET